MTCGGLLQPAGVASGAAVSGGEPVETAGLPGADVAGDAERDTAGDREPDGDGVPEAVGVGETDDGDGVTTAGPAGGAGGSGGGEPGSRVNASTPAAIPTPTGSGSHRRHGDRAGAVASVGGVPNRSRSGVICAARAARAVLSRAST